MAAPAILHLNGSGDNADFIYIGDTYLHQFTFEDELENPIDKSAKTYTAEIRADKASTVVLASFAYVISGAGNNILTISLTATETGALIPGKYVWDLRESEGATVTTIVYGDALVVDDVTKVV